MFGAINGGKCLDQLSHCQIIKKGFSLTITLFWEVLRA